MSAKLYLRRSGSFGASYGRTADTGHTILEDSGRFTVYSVHLDERVICENATREDAERAIERDWNASS